MLLALQLRNAIFAVVGNVTVAFAVHVQEVKLSYVRLLNHNTVDDITLVGSNVTTGQAVSVQDFSFSKNASLAKSYSHAALSLFLLQGTHSKTTPLQLYILILFILNLLQTLDHVSVAQTCLQNIHIVSCTQVGLSHCTLSIVLSTAMYKYQLE